MNALKKILLAMALALAAIGSAYAQTTTLDQISPPIPATTNTTGTAENLIQSYAVPGGALYQFFYRQPGQSNNVLPGGLTFVPGGSGSALSRFFALTDGHSDLGVPMTAAAGTPSGTVGISRTAGTSLYLAGETTSSSAKTDKVIFESNLGSTYIAAANLPVIVNANYTGSGTPTAATTTITVTAYTEIAGVETALTVSAAQQFTGTATNYTFIVTGAASGLVYGSHIVVEVVMLVTNASGGNTGQINSVALSY